MPNDAGDRQLCPDCTWELTKEIRKEAQAPISNPQQGEAVAIIHEAAKKTQLGAGDLYAEPLTSKRIKRRTQTYITDNGEDSIANAATWIAHTTLIPHTPPPLATDVEHSISVMKNHPTNALYQTTEPWRHTINNLTVIDLHPTGTRHHGQTQPGTST